MRPYKNYSYPHFGLPVLPGNHDSQMTPALSGPSTPATAWQSGYSSSHSLSPLLPGDATTQTTCNIAIAFNSTTSVNTHQEAPLHQQEIKDLLHSWFDQHMQAFTGDESGLAHDMENLINDRARTLAMQGENRQSVEATFDKGKSLDRISSMAVGSANAAAFAVAALVLDQFPKLTAADTDFMRGYLSGIWTGGLDVLMEHMLEHVTQDAFWLHSPEAKLDPCMAAALQHSRPSTLRQLGEMGTTNQTYTLRSGLNLAATSLAAAAHSTFNQQHNIELSITACGGLVAGAARDLIQNEFHTSQKRAGPEYLLARDDWQARYQALKQASYGKQSWNGFNRVKDFNKQIMKELTSLKACQALLTPRTLISVAGVLAPIRGGLRVALEKNTNRAESGNWSGLKTTALNGIIKTALAPVQFTVYPFALTWSGPIMQKAHDFIEETNFTSSAMYAARAAKTWINKQFESQPAPSSSAPEYEMSDMSQPPGTSDGAIEGFPFPHTTANGFREDKQTPRVTTYNVSESSL